MLGENQPASIENGDPKGLNQKRWTFFAEEDSTSSSSSVPDNLNLIDGEIEIIQRSQTLTEEDKILPGTALHKIRVKDGDRKLLAKCGSVNTDWAVELESSFLRGGQLLVRKVLPGSTLSHCYDNQGAFDRVVIRAHLTATNGNTVLDGYYSRRQKLSNPLERSHALKKLEAVCRGKHFEKLRDTRADSVPGIEQRNAGGDASKLSKLSPENSSPNSIKETSLNSNNTHLTSKTIPGLLSASGDNEPIQLGKESAKINNGAEAKRGPKEECSRTASKTIGEKSDRRKPQTVDLPDPENVPKAVSEVRNFEDVLANKKVINYLSRLENGAGVINSHLENNMEVSEEDIKSLSSATSAILREYGYDFSESPRIKNYSKRRYTRKTRDPRGETESSSSGSDVSDSELKSEVIKRVIEGRDFTGLLDSLKNSKEWKESVKEDLISERSRPGKIERIIHEYLYHPDS